MNEKYTNLRINAQRLRRDFEKLSRVGATAEGGVNRPALSIAHLQARLWFRQQIETAGLEVQIDAAGNHSARLACAPPGAPTLLLGSHLDSVPHGGRYDGALGVLAALEALRVVKENRLSLPVNLEAIDFTDEEGTLLGLLGSAALAGKLTIDDLQNPRGGRIQLLEGLARAGLSEESILEAVRNPQQLAGYLELHIEQGGRLLQSAVDIGVVSAIVGIASCQLTFIGQADHAGTTPMHQRLDAALGASAFTLAVRETVLEHFSSCVANVGDIQLSPGAYNIVPQRAVLALEYRAADLLTLKTLGEALFDQARQAAERYHLELQVEIRGSHSPSPMSPLARDAIRTAAKILDLSVLEMPSGAGHDAQSLAELCPVGMIFIPSQGGSSHSPAEYSRWQDCLNGANVLLQAALHMAMLR